MTCRRCNVCGYLVCDDICGNCGEVYEGSNFDIGSICPDSSVLVHNGYEEITAKHNRQATAEQI